MVITTGFPNDRGLVKSNYMMSEILLVYFIIIRGITRDYLSWVSLMFMKKAGFCFAMWLKWPCLLRGFVILVFKLFVLITYCNHLSLSNTRKYFSTILGSHFKQHNHPQNRGGYTTVAVKYSYSVRTEIRRQVIVMFNFSWNMYISQLKFLNSCVCLQMTRKSVWI